MALATSGTCAPYDEWLARGLLLCLRCRRWMIPIRLVDVDGGRAYSCGPRCDQPCLPAAQVESHLLLGGLIRGAVARTDCARTGPAVDADELRRWQESDPSSRRAVMLAAYTRVEVIASGALRPVWRHLPEPPPADILGQSH